MLHDVAGRVRRRGMIILISDLLADADRLLAGLKHIRYRRHEIVVFHVLDQHELTFPFDRLTLFKGMEGYPEPSATPISPSSTPSVTASAPSAPTTASTTSSSAPPTRSTSPSPPTSPRA